MPGQKAIQVIRERLFVALTERGRTTSGINSTGAHRVHEVAHVESGANVFRGMHLAAWA